MPRCFLHPSTPLEGPRFIDDRMVNNLALVIPPNSRILDPLGKEGISTNTLRSNFLSLSMLLARA